MKRVFRRRSLGFTLVELMIALGLGLFLTTVAISLLLSVLGSNRDLLRITRLNQDVRQLLNVMQRDLSRAGHWNAAGAVAQASATQDLQLSAVTGSVTVRAYLRGTTTPGTAFAAPLTSAVLSGRSLVLAAVDADGQVRRYRLTVTGVSNASTLTASVATAPLPGTLIPAGSWSVLNPFSAVTATSTCLLFSYDEDGDGVRGERERFGYRYDSASKAIQAVNNTDSCTAGAWQELSDARVFRVTGLGIVPSVAAADAGGGLRWITREYGVSIAAVLVSDASADRSLRASAKLRNLAVE